MAAPPWLLSGANGFTGRLVAEHAVQSGMAPVLAGSVLLPGVGFDVVPSDCLAAS